MEYTKVDDPAHEWHPYKSWYYAAKGGARFVADNPIELLGLAAMWEVRGDDWQKTKAEPDLLDVLGDGAKVFDQDCNEIEDS